MKNLKEINNYTFSITAVNRPDMVLKIIGLLTRRKFSVKSISIGDSADGLLRLTLVITGNIRDFYQVRTQINKITDIVKIDTLNDLKMIEREVALIKLKNSSNKKNSIFKLINSYQGRIVDFNKSSMIIEISGKKKRIDKFIEYLSEFSISDIARTGVTAMSRIQS